MSWCLSGGGWLMTGATLLVVVAAVWTVARLFPAAGPTDAAGVLDARLARGEIDVQTYRGLRTALGDARPDADAHRRTGT